MQLTVTRDSTNFPRLSQISCIKLKHVRTCRYSINYCSTRIHKPESVVQKPCHRFQRRRALTRKRRIREMIPQRAEYFAKHPKGTAIAAAPRDERRGKKLRASLFPYESASGRAWITRARVAGPLIECDCRDGRNSASYIATTTATNHAAWMNMNETGFRSG